MIKKFKILFIIIGVFASIIIFFSYGFQTSNFNELIQKRFNEQYKKIKLEFKNVRISLDIKDFAIKFSLN